ncbi:septum formation protein Maf, partial [Candidatus Woesebacteria bacterium]|nr:septum formation protein Maf [Candidatus Woesebacteria bacterium]
MKISDFSTLMRGYSIGEVAFGEKNYPRLLKKIKNPPKQIYFRGDLRQELFKKFGFEFIVQPSDFDERAVEIGDPEKLVKTLALAKAKGVAERFSGSLVVGADTVVFHNGEIFGKPQSAAHAKEMLKKLNGDTHSVITGLSLYDADTHQFVVDAVETFVSFKPISDAEIDAYVKSQEPFGKAGGYTVQGLAGLFVDRIQGDYFNVLGLPLDLLAHRLSEFG